MNGEFSYDSASIRELLARFIHDCDEQALLELIQKRKPFIWSDKKRFNLADYIRVRREWLNDRYSTEVLDCAYEIVIDRFHNIPSSDSSHGEHSRADCRNYYRALLSTLTKDSQSSQNSVQRDLNDEYQFQRFVNYHMNLSIQEALRKCNGHVHRYTWNVNGQRLVLKMPRTLAGADKARWLAENIAPEFLTDKDARARIQSVVDEKLLNRPNRPSFVEERNGTYAERWSFEHEVSSKGLALAIADEKASTIDELRPSIRRLGQDALRELVLEVFEGLERGGYDEGTTAARYGLSKSSFSRFCGSRWSRARDGGRPLQVPDLWANFAGLLAKSERFREAAQSAGVWDTVQTVVASASPASEHKS